MADTLTTYTGYPSLDQVAMDANDARLKPRHLLRLWYLAQALHGQTVRRRDLLALWEGSAGTTSSFVVFARDGLGVFWESAGWGKLRLYDANALHARLQVPYRHQVRFPLALTRGAKEFHTHLAECHVLSYVRDETGLSEPVTRAEVAESVGLCHRSVVTHLAKSQLLRPVPQYLRVDPQETTAAWREAARRHPRAHLTHVAGAKGLFRRLPDRFYVEQAPSPGWRRTRLGELLRAGVYPALPSPDGMSMLWDGTSEKKTGEQATSCRR